MSIIEIDQKRKSTLLKYFFILSLIIHILFVILYAYLKYFDLLKLGIINSCILLFNLFLLRKKKYLLSMQIGVIAIVVISFISTYYLGWKSYFSLYLIASAIIIINSLSLKQKWKIMEVVVITLLFIVLFISTNNENTKYLSENNVMEWIGQFNILAVLFAILFMQFQNFIENENLKKMLEEISNIDILTGAYNRRFFTKYLDVEIKRLGSQIKYQHSLEVNFGIAMIDIDDFKNVNDKYGHLIGDAVIVEVAHIIKAVIFERDLFCRYGGDEFVVLFTSTLKPGAIKAINKILNSVENIIINTNKGKQIIRIAVSIGFASFDEESDLYKLLDIADRRLYTAKRMGKNRVVYE
jgi:diguanylate cyclase (GGDEF)-like protein